MSPVGDRQVPEWLRIGPAPEGTLDSPSKGLEGAWRAWEWLRRWDRAYAWVVDTVIALGLFVVSTGWLVAHDNPRLAAGWVAALTLPLILRRRYPILVFAVIAAVALAQFFATVPGLADASLCVALYTVASESNWAQVVAASAALETGVVMATVHWRPTGNHFKSFVFLSGLAVAALFAGLVVRVLRGQLGWLAERAQRLEHERDQQASLAAAAERARIAREMHDVVSHNIQVMVTLADAAGAAQAIDPPRSSEAMVEVSATGRQALIDMRRMLGVLRDGGDGGGGGGGVVGGGVASGGVSGVGRAPLAPQPGLGDLEALVERVRATGLDVTVSESGRRFTLSEAAELTVFRIVQEALTNALKHAADPRSVLVAIAYDDPEVSVRVTDDGRAGGGRANGNDHGAANGSGRSPSVNGGAGGGHGVAGMAERAAAFGGSLRAGPRSEGGWEVEATLRGCKAPARA